MVVSVHEQPLLQGVRSREFIEMRGPEEEKGIKTYTHTLGRPQRLMGAKKSLLPPQETGSSKPLWLDPLKSILKLNPHHQMVISTLPSRTD